MNVNLDVLELIFGHLDKPDLAAAALVSRAFLAAAIPALYARIEYTLRHAKRAHHEISPFAAIAAHGNLVVHVKHIAVHAAPAFQPASNIPSPAFLEDLTHAVVTATNLRSFVCTVKILPPLLPHLSNKPRLHHLRICAALGSRQTAVLQNRTGLCSLALDSPSWNVVDVLPKWTASMQRTLAHLTLFTSQDTDAAVLNAILAQLPRLRGLHVIDCPRITHTVVLKALSHTPDLRELSFTIFPFQENTFPPFNFPVPPLTHLSIDIRASYPGLKALVARIISRLSPRDALAICGRWIGEIKGSLERTDNANDPGAPGPAAGPGGPFGQNTHIWHGHIHLHNPMPGHAHPHGHDQADPPLLTPPNPHHGNVHPGVPPPIPGNPIIGFPFPLPIGNLNGNNNNINDPPAAGPPNPDNNHDPNAPSLVSSLPSTLSILHLPEISPAGLKEVVERCEGIQVLGIVIGSAFSSPASAKPGKTNSRSPSRPGGQPVRPGVRTEISMLAGILSRARVLRELIIDTSAAHFFANTSSPNSNAATGTSHGAPPATYTLLALLSARMLMRELPLLRRIVGEGRVWESPTPTPSSPIHFPHCLPIELTLTKARYGPGTGHGHGPTGFAHRGGGYGQIEGSNNHWFWLTGSASGGKVYHGY